jgi:hypothetical protein
MFVDSIENVSSFTRSINTISRTYNGKTIIPGSATLFFVNEDGYAITCRHVTDVLVSSEEMNKKFIEFKNERNKIPQDGKFNKALMGLEMKYHYNSDTLIQVKNNFIDCVDKLSGFTVHSHPKYDLAIIKFNDYGKTFYTGHAKFLKDSSKIKQGNFLCRLGFPFPEFNNFKYNEPNDDIEWTTTGIQGSPRFPIEGMVTRFLAEDPKQFFGIELSTPGLRGQSGGPLFDKKGIIYGMQFSTKHLHLGFDITDKEILSNNKVKKVSDYSFIHLGQCIHVDVIKEFLKEKGVRYYEED